MSEKQDPQISWQRALLQGAFTALHFRYSSRDTGHYKNQQAAEERLPMEQVDASSSTFAHELARLMPGCDCELVFPPFEDVGVMIVSPTTSSSLSDVTATQYLVIGMAYIESARVALAHPELCQQRSDSDTDNEEEESIDTLLANMTEETLRSKYYKSREGASVSSLRSLIETTSERAVNHARELRESTPSWDVYWTWIVCVGGRVLFKV